MARDASRVGVGPGHWSSIVALSPSPVISRLSGYFFNGGSPRPGQAEGQVLSQSVGRTVEALIAGKIAHELGSDHLEHGFFAGASLHGGIATTRV